MPIRGRGDRTACLELASLLTEQGAEVTKRSRCYAAAPRPVTAEHERVDELTRRAHVPANGIAVTDVITFDGMLTPDATTATLTFSFLFPGDPGFDARELQVENLQLEPFTT